MRDIIPGRGKGLGKDPTMESVKSSVYTLRFCSSSIVTAG